MAAVFKVPFNTSPFPGSAGGNLAFETFILDATTDQMEYVFQAEEACTITSLGYRQGVRAGTPPTYKISLQGVTDGLPDGTIKGGGSPASKTFTPPASTAWDNTWQWLTLDNTYTCTRGEVLAIVIAYSTGTIGVANSITATHDLIGFTGRQGFPYAIQNNAGSRTKSTQIPIYGYKSSTTTYGLPFPTIVSTQFSSDSTPSEYALAFTRPTAAVGATYAVMGARFHMTTPAAAKSFSMNLYEGTTVRQTVTWDSDNMRLVGNSSQYVELLFTDSALFQLSYGTEYYLSLLALSTTANVAISMVTANSAQDAAVSGSGTYYKATRAGAAWTLDTTTRPMITLLLQNEVTALTIAMPAV